MKKKFGNLPTRVIVAVVGIPVILIASLVGKIPFLGLALIIGLVSFFEFSKMMHNKHIYTNKLIGYFAVAAIIINGYKFFIDYYQLFLIVIISLTLIELFRNRESAVSNIGSTLLGIFYIGLLASTIVGIREFYNDSVFTYSQGGYLIISILASIWICDSAAYFIGSAYGKHKILPRVSPNKSWEGTVSGFIFSIAAMIAAHEFILDFMELKDVIVIGIIAGSFGQIGDFIESQFKRDAHVKDSSSILPGHGGIFDRFDSLLYTAPVVYLYLTHIKSLIEH